MKTRLDPDGSLWVCLPFFQSEQEGSVLQEFLRFEENPFYEGQHRHKVWIDWIRRHAGKDAK